MASPTLAIDFGTSRTKVAYFNEVAGKAQLVEIGREIRTVFPSVFYIPKEGQGERLVGDDAQDMVDSDPEGIVLSLKKELHKLGKKRCGPDRPAVDRIQLASDLFSHIYQRCRSEIFFNETLSHCRLTVPVDFKAQQREAIKSAAQLGGFQEVSIIEEPVAAAQHWLLSRSNEKFGDSVVVCDVGGGTTDFAFLRYVGGRFQADETVLSAGFPLGGNDLDEFIWERIGESEPVMVQYKDRAAAILIKIRRERELIAKTRKPEIRLSVDGQQIVFPRSVIEDATSEFVERVKAETLRFLDKIADQAKITEAPLLLVGGASRLPGLDHALNALQRGSVFLWNDCDYATVLGAVDIPRQSLARSQRPETIRTLVSDGRCEEAFESVSQMMVTNPNSDLFALWIECSTSVANVNTVLATAREIHQKRQQDVWGICCLASTLSDVGRNDEAEELIAPFVSKPEWATYPLVWTRYCLKSDPQLLEELLALNPNEPSLLAFRAFATIVRTKFTDEVAKHQLVSVLDQNPNSFITLFFKLLIELESDFLADKEDFKADVRQMERISPNNFYTNFIVGTVIINEERNYHSARERFNKVISDPRSQGSKMLTGLAFLNRAICNYRLEDFSSARTDINNCLLLIPGNFHALNFSGRLFCDAENYKDALKDFQKAAYDGYADAQNNLGGMYFSGLGIAKNDNEALIWYRKAAEQGHANAQNSLGSMYFNGQGLAKDDIQALTWYRKAAEQGHANAQYSMGWMYENGVAVAKDDACAANWYQKSADQGHAWAQNNLGTLYFSGQGVAKDEKRAFGWYQEAANQGHADAQSSIGAMYFNGQGVAKDNTQAFSWYRKAADQGLVGAQYSIGWMYENGIGTTLDTTQAVEWYKKAAAQGQADAQAAVSRLMGMVAQTHSGSADRKLAVNNTETRAVQGANRFVAGQPWTNSLSVKFVPAGTDGVLFSVWDVRVKDFKAFVDATGYDLDTWKSPGFRQTEDHPVVRVTWYDAKAYCDWLTKKEQTEGKLGPNQKYRLPTDMEWSRAVGLNESAGGTPKSKDPSRFINPFYKYIFPWGTQWPPPKGAGNYAESLTQDGYIYTSPVGSFTANQYGLYDMGGNVWQMCECKYDGESEHRVVRGGAYYLVMETQLDSRNRCCTLPDHRDEHQGFRVVLLV